LLLSYCALKLTSKVVTARLMKAKRKTSNKKKHAIKRHAYKQSNESICIICVYTYTRLTHNRKNADLLVWCPQAQVSLV